MCHENDTNYLKRRTAAADESIYYSGMKIMNSNKKEEEGWMAEYIGETTAYIFNCMDITDFISIPTNAVYECYECCTEM